MATAGARLPVTTLAGMVQPRASRGCVIGHAADVRRGLPQHAPCALHAGELCARTTARTRTRRAHTPPAGPAVLLRHPQRPQRTLVLLLSGGTLALDGVTAPQGARLRDVRVSMGMWTVGNSAGVRAPAAVRLRGHPPRAAPRPLNRAVNAAVVKRRLPVPVHVGAHRASVM